MNMEDFRQTVGQDNTQQALFNFQYNMNALKSVVHDTTDRLLDTAEAVILGLLQRVGASIN